MMKITILKWKMVRGGMGYDGMTERGRGIEWRKAVRVGDSGVWMDG